MDWEAKGPWKIKDLKWNSMIMNDTLMMAYYKARALDLMIGIRKVTPKQYELFNVEGKVINTIKGP